MFAVNERGRAVWIRSMSGPRCLGEEKLLLMLTGLAENPHRCCCIATADLIIAYALRISRQYCSDKIMEQDSRERICAT
jgi:hypothetical protein